MRVHFLEKIIFGCLSLILFGGLIFILVRYPALHSNNLASRQSTVTATRVVIDGSQGNAKPLTAKDGSLEIYSPMENQTIHSPVTIVGRAKGWFFEGSFPVVVLDDSYNVLGSGVAVAQSDWMSSDFVDLKAVINFNQTTKTNGYIKLVKDNPSGLKANSQEFIFHVKFN